MAAFEIPTTETGLDGRSRFGTTTIAIDPKVFAPPAPAFGVSEPMPAERVVWFRLEAGWVGDWHPAPHHQLYVQMSGRLEVTVSNGQSRILAPGDVLWTRDTSGVGHQSRVVGLVPATGLFVQLPPTDTTD